LHRIDNDRRLDSPIDIDLRQFAHGGNLRSSLLMPIVSHACRPVASILRRCNRARSFWFASPVCSIRVDLPIPVPLIRLTVRDETAAKQQIKFIMPHWIIIAANGI
jgi:hypothetical protein